MVLGIIIALVVVALFFDFTNGFHDAANAIATSVFTRALTPRIALTLAAGHGLQDAQKTMGVIFLALATGGCHGW